MPVLAPHSLRVNWARSRAGEVEERARAPCPACGAGFVPCQLLVLLSQCVWMWLVIVVWMLAACGWAGMRLCLVLAGGGGLGPVELFMSGEAFGVAGKGFAVWFRKLSPWVFVKAGGGRSCLPFPGHVCDSGWPWGVPRSFHLAPDLVTAPCPCSGR